MFLTICFNARTLSRLMTISSCSYASVEFKMVHHVVIERPLASNVYATNRRFVNWSMRYSTLCVSYCYQGGYIQIFDLSSQGRDIVCWTTVPDTVIVLRTQETSLFPRPGSDCAWFTHRFRIQGSEINSARHEVHSYMHGAFIYYPFR